MIWNTDGVNPDWPIKPLARLTTKVGSGATPRGGRRSYPDHGTPFIRSQNVHFDGFTTDGLAFLTNEQARQLDGVTVQAGDVLLNITGASIGRVCVAPAEIAGARVNQHVCIIRPDGVKAAFLAQYLASPQVQDAIVFGNYGVTREALTKSQILELPVPAPDPDVQDTLVELVDTAMGHRIRATAHRAAAEQAVERMRQAAVAAACSGRLTEGWREANLASRPADLAAARQRRANQKGRRFKAPTPNPHADDRALPENWQRSPLGIALREIKYGTSKRSEYGGNGIAVLRIPNVSGSRLDIADLKFAPLDAKEADLLRLHLGDLLMIRSNGSVQLVGKALPITGEAVDMAYAGYLMRLRVDEEVLLPEFFNLALSSPDIRHQVEMPLRSTSGVNNINTDEIRGLVIPVPPIKEQQEIVRRTSDLRLTSDILLSRLSGADRTVERIDRAILAKAFRGELAPESIS